jgi:hypothetical protein
MSKTGYGLNFTNATIVSYPLALVHRASVTTPKQALSLTTILKFHNFKHNPFILLVVIAKIALNKKTSLAERSLLT